MYSVTKASSSFRLSDALTESGNYKTDAEELLTNSTLVTQHDFVWLQRSAVLANNTHNFCCRFCHYEGTESSVNRHKEIQLQCSYNIT